MKTTIYNKVTDSEASAFIEQKGVILCRSGIQLYHKSELEGFITADNKPPVEKEWYKEYRPANVVVKAQEKCKSLPVTREHPFDWVTPKNFSDLAGGTTDKEVSVVALEGESEGEIGLRSDLTFYTEGLYDYYKDNKEVSLGYTCRKHFVDNPEEVGYDIILDEIMEVNHLAITRRGRGGSSVAVIDSIIGGMKPMRTGIFAFLRSKKQNDSAPVSFGNKVFSALKESKGTTEEMEAEVKCVLDSCAELKDGDKKTLLMDAVRDCFDHKEASLAQEEELVKTMDAMWEEANAESLKAFTVASKDSEEPKEDENKDSEEPKEDENKDSEEPKEDESKDSEEPKEDENKDRCKDSTAFDSASFMAEIKDSLKPMIKEAVQEVLGIAKDSKPSVKGSEIDSANRDSEVDLGRDYSSFLEA